jgi:WhiB family redox-sensing transcriptional regulator
MNPHLRHTRHAQVTGILQSGGTARDVARILGLTPDLAEQAIYRARKWHRRHPGDHTGSAVPLGVPLQVIRGGPACAEVDPELFFIGETRNADAGVDAAARKVCAGCPVRTPCAEYALADPSLHGIWGGLSADERRDMRRRGKDAK